MKIARAVTHAIHSSRLHDFAAWTRVWRIHFLATVKTNLQGSVFLLFHVHVGESSKHSHDQNAPRSYSNTSANPGSTKGKDVGWRLGSSACWTTRKAAWTHDLNLSKETEKDKDISIYSDRLRVAVLKTPKVAYVWEGAAIFIQHTMFPQAV